MLDKSIDAMVAAIEIYNKPRFAHREESFSMLAINAWELLLKARLLQINANQLASILEYERRQRADGTPSPKLYRKKNRSGNCVTIGLFKAHDRLVTEYGDAMSSAIRTNLEALVEIRDNSVHFLNEDLALTTSIHEIGSAAIKNYTSAVRQWFGVDLSEHSFALMPLAFLAVPARVEGLPLNTEERHLFDYLARVRAIGEADDDDFNVALRIEVRVRRTKDVTAVPVVSSREDSAIPVAVEEEDIRERYPWSYEILTARLQHRFVNFKANDKYHSLRRPLQADPRFCRERLLDPGKPDGTKKRFYNPNIVKEFDAHYERRKPEVAAADPSPQPAPGATKAAS